MQLALRGSAANIRIDYIDGDGAATAPTSPTVTIVRDSDGETIEDGSAATVDGNGARFTLNPATIAEVDLLRVGWGGTGATAPDQLVGVVGGFLCSLEAISGDDPRSVREQAEEWIEHSCGCAFRPRYHRERLPACEGSLLLSRPLVSEVLAATIDGEAIDLDGLTVEANGVARSEGWRGTVDIAYVHGHLECPEPISRAAATLAQHIAEGGDANRISRFREDDQEIFFTLPGPGHATGLPDVDTAIDVYRFPSVG